MPRRKKGIMEVDLEASIANNDNLSVITKRNYRDRVRAMVQKSDGKTIAHIVLNPDTFGPLIRQWYAQNTSQKANFTVILSLFRYNPEFKEQHKDAHDKWIGFFKETDQKVKDRYESNMPSSRQVQGYVPYDDIIRVRDSLPEGDIHRLLLGMYTHIKPLRAEYARIPIFRNAVPKANVEPNYILLAGAKAQLVIGQFKTMKHHDRFDISMPDPLVKDLLASLKAAPRDWLFVNTTGMPFGQSLFSQWTGKIFAQLFGKPLNIQLIRHSFVNTLDFNTLTIVEKKALASEMGHTLHTQDQYRLIFKDSKQECTCACTNNVKN